MSIGLSIGLSNGLSNGLSIGLSILLEHLYHTDYTHHSDNWPDYYDEIEISIFAKI